VGARGSAEKVLHSINGTGGADPYAGLIDVKGTLYGTTALLGSAYVRPAFLQLFADDVLAPGMTSSHNNNMHCRTPVRFK
jgi:hypothetical protein